MCVFAIKKKLVRESPNLASGDLFAFNFEHEPKHIIQGYFEKNNSVMYNSRKCSKPKLAHEAKRILCQCSEKNVKNSDSSHFFLKIPIYAV
jgi:hypothetical protein